MSEQIAQNYPVDPAQVKPGDLMSFTYYGVVETNQDGQSLRLVGQNLTPGVNTFEVAGAEVIRASKSADYFAEERKVCRTEIAETLISSDNKPFTVCFVKQDGEIRCLRGRFLAHERMFGRSRVLDLDVRRDDPSDDGIRLVDHRTLESLICDGIKYVRSR